jgi:hypothetical protein
MQPSLLAGAIDLLVIDIRAIRQQLDGSSQLGGMPLHTEAARQALHVLVGVRTRDTLVIAERDVGGGGQGLREERGAAMGAWDERRIPVAIGGATAGNKHDRWERAITGRVSQAGVDGNIVQHPCNLCLAETALCRHRVFSWPRSALKHGLSTARASGRVRMLLAVVLAVASSALLTPMASGSHRRDLDVDLLAPLQAPDQREHALLPAVLPIHQLLCRVLLARDHTSRVTPHDEHTPKPVNLTSIESSMPWFNLTCLPSGERVGLGDCGMRAATAIQTAGSQSGL